ncbi:MAG: FtsX-like permease family protein [Bacteroidales bacterium]|nr:FtsX-like permease family protein [Bacteroidales bacterium]
MNLPFYIAKRYLFSKKSHNVINIISGISVIGVTIGTMALIIILSVFNGFEELVTSLFNTFDPDLQITVKEGKTFEAPTLPSDSIKQIPGVVRYTEVVEETVLLKFRAKQYLATLKGVSEDFERLSDLNNMVIDGELVLERKGQPLAFLGFGVAYSLGVGGHDQPSPITVYVPKRTKKTLGSLDQAFNSETIFPSGIFSVQQDFDSKYMIVPIRFARKLLEYTNEVTSIEIGLVPDVDANKIQQKIIKIVGDKYIVKNRLQQQELLYKIMKSEKWAIFFILTFILIIATFNVISSLSMLILEKKKDIAVLWSMGASNALIRRIFMIEGLLISLTGALLGIILGGVIAWLQQTFGLIELQAGSGSFIIDAYPVKMKVFDFVTIFFTVFLIGFVSTWYPVRQISKKYMEQKLA